jgi:carboxyl-terminal processing protease
MRIAAPARRMLALGGICALTGCGTSTVRNWRGVPPSSLRSAYVDQFDTLWTRFNDVYPSFGYKRVDWKAARDHYRPRAIRARSQDELVAVLLEMLAPLQDRHIWLVDPRGAVVPSFQAPLAINFERPRWEAALRDANYVAQPGDVGDGLIGGYGYLFLGSWRAPVDEEVLDAMMQRAQHLPGLIIDVRANAGGSDQLALALARRFTTRSFPASYVEIRTDPRVVGAEMPLARSINPRGPWQYTKPVVVIAGRGGLSATESFVAAMRTLPQVTVIGDTTGGASGNPGTHALGNGWQFTVPRWLEFGPDRQPIEGRGVAPTVAMPWHPQLYDRARDPLIDAAVGMLGERTGVYRILRAAADSSGKSPDGRSPDGKSPDGKSPDRR